MKVGCALLAAGAGKRFGEGKLLYSVQGEPMIARALRLYASLPFAARICVTRAEANEIRQFAFDNAFPVAINPDPERGVGTSVAIATEAILAREPALDGVLYAVADQPYLKCESVSRLISAFETNPKHIVSLAFGSRRGNPAIFPADLYTELCALKEDIGGSAVIKQYPQRLMLVEAGEAQELFDIDTRQ
ncbi:MAG: nucleotidyltransferase family protein [Eubacteriales bacterium]|nr:nucleotidyltransferase family protein [Eubacteriales bacterium]